MLENTTKTEVCELVSPRTYIYTTRKNALAYLNQKDPNVLLQKMDQVCKIENRVAGLFDNATDPKNRPDPYRLAYIDNTVTNLYMYATQYHTGYNTTAMQAVLDVDHFTNDGWGPWHEQGHTRQTPSWRWIEPLTEVTNNIFSMSVGRENGQKSRLEQEGCYDKALTFFNSPNKDFDSIDDVFLQLVMFWQLDLGFGPNFYPRLHQMYRKLNKLQIPPALSGDIGKQMFIQMASICAERNLTPFFDMWGMSPSEKTFENINSLPTLNKQIWLSTDSSPMVEYRIPDNFDIPQMPNIDPPQNLDGQRAVIASYISDKFALDLDDDGVAMATRSNNLSQQWQLIKQGDYFVLKNLQYISYIKDIDGTIGVTNDIDQATKFSFVLLESTLQGHLYELHSSNRLLTIDGTTVQDGTKLTLIDKNFSINQRFVINFE